MENQVYNRITYDYGNGHFKSFVYGVNFVKDKDKKETIKTYDKVYERDYLKESISRAKRNLYHIAHSNDWQYFGTLTIDKNKLDRYDYDLYKEKLTQFFNYWRKKYASDLKYIFVIEPHKDGAFHSHYLASNIGKFEFGKIDNYDTVPFYKLGRNTIEEVKDTQRVASYIISYISKDFDIPKGKQRYCCSQNLNKPNIIRDSVLFSDIYKFDDNITVNYIKDIDSYIPIKIIDFSIDK